MSLKRNCSEFQKNARECEFKTEKKWPRLIPLHLHEEWTKKVIGIKPLWNLRVIFCIYVLLLTSGMYQLKTALTVLTSFFVFLNTSY